MYLNCPFGYLNLNGPIYEPRLKSLELISQVALRDFNNIKQKRPEKSKIRNYNF